MVITMHPTVITCNYGNSNLRSNITMKELPFGILRPRSFSGCIPWTSLRTATTVPLPYTVTVDYGNIKGIISLNSGSQRDLLLLS